MARGEALPLLATDKLDPRRIALVEGNAPVMGAPPAGARESVEIGHDEPDMLTLTARAAAPGLLVVSEVYATGWQAEVDGHPVDVLPTDHLLQGVPIPAGVHTVELRYQPRELRLGLLITEGTVVTVLIALLGTWWGARRRRSGSRPCSPHKRRMKNASPRGQEVCRQRASVSERSPSPAVSKAAQPDEKGRGVVGGCRSFGCPAQAAGAGHDDGNEDAGVCPTPAGIPERSRPAGSLLPAPGGDA